MFASNKKTNSQPKLALLPPRDLTGTSYLNQQSFMNQMGDVCILSWNSKTITALRIS